MVLPTKQSPAQLPAISGQVMVDAPRGRVRVRKWPRKRGKPKSKAQATAQEWFRQATWLMKFLPAEFVQQAELYSRGTPFLTRDILMMAMSGRLFGLILPDGRRLYPMAYVRDVSQSLDALGQAPGSLLVRGADRWQSVEPGTAGFVLTSGGPGQVPAWAQIPEDGDGGDIPTAFLPIENPGAEAGMAGWVGYTGAMSSVTAQAHTGSHSFRTGAVTNEYGTATPPAYPPELWDAIDAEQITTRLYWWQGENSAGSRTGGMRMRFLDRDGNLLLQVSAPSISTVLWTERTLEATTPPGTRSVDLRMYSNAAGTSGNLVYYDSISCLAFDAEGVGGAGLQLPQAVSALLPSPTPPGRLIYVLDQSPTPVPAYCDGVNWRSLIDGSIIG